jgi:hypothetical protein
MPARTASHPNIYYGTVQAPMLIPMSATPIDGDVRLAGKLFNYAT